MFFKSVKMKNFLQIVRKHGTVEVLLFKYLWKNLLKNKLQSIFYKKVP